MSVLREQLDALRARRRAAAIGVPADPGAAGVRAAASVLPARSVQEVFGGCEWTCDCGGCWCVTTPAERVEGRPAGICAIGSEARLLDLGLEAPAHFQPRQAMVLDIETGGFAGAPVFLIGAVLLSEDELRVTQWLARDYPEERAILRGLAGAAAAHTTWITFNGKSFDGPFVRERAIVNRVPLAEPCTHLDLLHLARRRWRGRFPNFRLETLERCLCGSARVGDIPGADIPAMFHHFIRTGNAAPLRPVLEHNQRDLLTCVELLRRLLDGWMP